MAVYLVDRNLPGITKDRLVETQRAALETSRRFTEEGYPVLYTKCIFIPEESRCLCLFEAANADTVERVNEESRFPYTQVLKATVYVPGN